ncbi:MAG TPA: hypothetical protein VGI06_00410 [Acidimicrobiales bacterium]
MAVALAVILGFEIADLRGRPGVPTATAAETTVARNFAVAVTSFDYRRISQDTARAVAFGSPSYRPDLLAALGPSFVNGIVANKRISTGTVADGPVVQSGPPGRVVFLVVINQQITSVGSQSAPQTARVALVIAVSRGPSPAVVGVQNL